MKVLLFIGLKIIEISGFIFIPYFVGKIGDKLKGIITDDKIIIWLTGLLYILVTFFIIFASYLAGVLIGSLFKMNWELVNRILG